MGSKIEIIDGIRDLVRSYDALIIDLWGVIHDGVNLLPGSASCLAELNEAKISYAFLSNAPRRAKPLIDAMIEMGIPADHAVNVISSGEATHMALKERADPWFTGVGGRCYHLGPQRDHSLFDGLKIEFVQEVENADLIVNTGPWGFTERVADYEDLLQAGVKAGVKMVCANPDLEVIRGGRHMICAGALAVRYEEIGGNVIYYGKPKRPIYDACLATLNRPSPNRVLAIGDSLRTDIKGAETVGIDAILVLGGIHGSDFEGSDRSLLETRLHEKCEQAGVFPVAAVPTFRW
ncbi:MAG: TIGR01459 family HAD-type hydrolase [Rhodospirillaceae bacterium]